MKEESFFRELGQKIRELERENRELKKSLHLLHQKQLGWNAPGAISLLVDIDGTIVAANEMVAKRFDMPAKELIGRHVWDLFPEDVSNRRKLLLDKILRTGEPVHLEDQNLGRWFDSVIYPIKDIDGTIFQVAVFTRDITDRKLLEESLRIKDFALTSCMNGIAMSNLEGNLTYVNDAFLELWGYENHNEVLGKNVQEFWEFGKIAGNVIENIKRDSAWMGELEGKKRNGTSFTIYCAANLIKDTSGNPFGMMGSFIDITLLKQAEKNLTAREALLRTAIESLPFEFFALDRDERYIMQNKTCMKHWGNVLGQHPDDANVDTATLAIWKSNNKRAYNGETVEGEVQFTVDGELRYYHNIIAPIIDDGKVQGILGVNIDITERKKAETELHRYSRSQSILLREVNHRVTNNLSALISIIHKEEDQALVKNPDFVPWLQEFEKRVQGLLTVHRLLSRSGWEHVSLIELCDQVVKKVTENLPVLKRIDLSVTGDPVQLNSDRAHHIGIVLNELATNTLKHSLVDHDSVEIKIRIQNMDSMIHLSFKDNGPGFPEEVFHDNDGIMNIGFDLINGIVKNNLEGDMVLSNDNGAHVMIRFKNEVKL